ncbi:nucleotide-binding universal stress UspA family protein [Streptomyces sp. 846.5]|nr:universal stress protein [Streptomyces sp. 846.5]TDT97402.1 nucleotide-binding universal stress UspA family protein [Streptomyces sp. 846.5]
MKRPVIVGVDGSAQSIAAAHWAADEAVLRGSPLRLVYADPWLRALQNIDRQNGDERGSALRMLAQVQAELQERCPTLSIDLALVQGQVVEALVKTAHDGEITVLGSRGLGGFAELLLGSVSLATAARVDVPLIVLRPGTGPGTEQQRTATSQILVGLDAYDPSEAVLDFAFAEAALRGARIRVVHGWALPPSWSSLGWTPPLVQTPDLEAAEAAQLAKAMLSWRDKFPDTEVAEAVRLGGGAAALVEASDRADLVVVGRRARPHGAGLRLGAVAHAVLHHAKAPVAVVPHP